MWDKDLKEMGWEEDLEKHIADQDKRNEKRYSYVGERWYRTCLRKIYNFIEGWL